MGQEPPCTAICNPHDAGMTKELRLMRTDMEKEPRHRNKRSLAHGISKSQAWLDLSYIEAKISAFLAILRTEL